MEGQNNLYTFLNVKHLFKHTPKYNVRRRQRITPRSSLTSEQRQKLEEDRELEILQGES